MTDQAIVILVPVLNRPASIAPLLESIAATTTIPHHVLFLASPGEPDELAALGAAGADFTVVDWQSGPGDYARKINLGVDLTDEPLIFTAADDLRFHVGWDTEASRHMKGNVGVVGTNDLGNPRVMRGQHSTHSLVSRAYVVAAGTIDEPGKLLHEGYPHEYCDEELVQTARFRRAFAFARRSRVEHLHPHWGKAPKDDTYPPATNHPRLAAGRELYQERRRLWERARPAQRQRPERRVPARAMPPDPKRPVSVTVITASLPSRSAQLAQAIASVAAQTVEVAHAVLVDATRTVAEARNAMVGAAATEWVAFLDDDDRLDPGHVEALLAAGDGADVVIPYCRFDGRPLPVGYCNRDFDRADLAAHGVFPITVLARRAAVLAAGGFPLDEKWEDWALWNRMADAGAVFRVVPQVTWTYTTRTEDRRTRRLQAS